MPVITILYVNDLAVSEACYRGLLGAAPVETSPDFAMFALEGGGMLGLWRRGDVQPPAEASPGAGELVFSQADDAALAALMVRWAGQGLRIAQPIAEAVYGRNFLALDPDGHRLRAAVLGR